MKPTWFAKSIANNKQGRSGIGGFVFRQIVFLIAKFEALALEFSPLVLSGPVKMFSFQSVFWHLHRIKVCICNRRCFLRMQTLAFRIWWNKMWIIAIKPEEEWDTVDDVMETKPEKTWLKYDIYLRFLMMLMIFWLFYSKRRFVRLTIVQHVNTYSG